MTEEEFLIIVTDKYSTSVNIWYSETQPYTVLGATVPVKDGITGDDLTGYLRQVETLTVEVNEGQFITLKIDQRRLLGSEPFQYYYFKVDPIIIADTGDQKVLNGRIYISPGIQGSNFINSPYNIVQGTAEIPRQSDYIMQSDRASGTLKIVGGGLPTNIESLQSGSATKAYIQDSLYSDTGWTRARYNGTPTTRLTYGGIDPALQGNVFQGSYFTRTTLDSRIFSQSEADLVYTNYLFTGNQEVPQYETEYASSSLATDVDFTSTQQINITLDVANKIITRTGDLLRFSTSSLVVSGGLEIIKVESVKIINPTEIQLTVVRGWDQTPKSTYASNPKKFIHKITPVQIYKLSGNKIQGESRGKIKIKQTGDLVYIDTLGFIVTGSLN